MPELSLEGQAGLARWREEEQRDSSVFGEMQGVWCQ
jgi:hypothetical protein